MTNKNLFKKVYQENINKDKNYEKIISRIKIPKKSKSIYFKIAYTCLLIIFITSLLFISNKKHLYQKNNEEDIIKINIVDTKASVEKNNRNDGADDIKNDDINHELYSNIFLPKDFKKEKITKKIYIDDKHFNYYETVFESIDGNRFIIINYSKENKPLNIYSLENPEPSRINGNNLIIYSHNDKYISEFTYKKMNYLIETEDLSEIEFIKLLKSIIKEEKK